MRLQKSALGPGHNVGPLASGPSTGPLSPSFPVGHASSILVTWSASVNVSFTRPFTGSVFDSQPSDLNTVVEYRSGNLAVGYVDRNLFERDLPRERHVARVHVDIGICRRPWSPPPSPQL